MSATSIVRAGEAGIVTVVEGVARVHGALPENFREAADRKLGSESTLGKGVKAMVDTVVEESAKARVARSAAAAEIAAVRAMDAAELEEKVLALTDGAQEKAEKTRGPARRILLGGVMVGAAAGGAYFVWRRRKAAAVADLSGEDQGGASPAAEESRSGAVDDTMAREIDAVADEMATSVVEAIEVDGQDVPEHVAEAPEPAAAVLPETDEGEGTGEPDEAAQAIADDAAEAVADATEVVDDAADAAPEATEAPKPKKSTK